MELDHVPLYGTGIAPEPKGLINQVGLARVSMGAKGGALTNFGPFVAAMLAVEDANETPGATVFAPRTKAALVKLKDSRGCCLELPTKVNLLQILLTNHMSVNRTQGTVTNASDIFVSEWSELLIGMRGDLLGGFAAITSVIP